jgi:fatty-acyl-CoA synthase
MRLLYADSEVVSVRGGERTRASCGQVLERAERLSGVLERLGVERGDRVATFAWNTREHLEAYRAVPAWVPCSRRSTCGSSRTSSPISSTTPTTG